MTRPDGDLPVEPQLADALRAVRLARTRLEAAERREHGPIAIVGLAGRFPGAPDVDAFWTMLRAGSDAMRAVPPDRWDAEALYDPDPDAPGRTYVRRAGFIDDVDQFDAAFFGIAPREADALDPQHRILLETAWHALEHAGIGPDRLTGSATGVYLGISSSDYALLAFKAGISGVDPHVSTGNGFNAAAGRLSHAFGLQGPCLAVDTACSASLVAIHLACQALRAGECDLALAAGVNLMLAPDTTIGLSRMRVLAPDGRCKTFSAAADGMARGEGCGVVVLKRLAEAVHDGDRVLALVRGSATNHDGPSSGFTVPSGTAQRALIRRALAAARLEPRDIDYVEAHGTGTFLGDPIEVGALAAVFGPDRSPGRPLLVGSVKTNIGHLEAAAGLAGLAKVVLALDHGEIPPHLLVGSPNPEIPWSSIPVRVPVAAEPWPATDHPRRAGVSAFGLSGSNAHVVLEAAPADDRPPDGAVPRLLLLSAKTPHALRALVAAHAHALADGDVPRWDDTCRTARRGRARLRHRLALVADETTEAAGRLADFLAGGEAAGVVHGPVSGGQAPGPVAPPPAPWASDPETRRAWLLDLATRWVRGDELDWDALDVDPGARTTTLPAYPFERQRYWLDLPGTWPSAPHPVSGIPTGGADVAPSAGAGAPTGAPAGEPVGSPPMPRQDSLRRTRELHPRPPLATTLVGPRTELEAMLAAAWEGALGVAPVGVFDDFHELGGDSVLAAQIATRLRNEHAIEVLLSAVLDAGTVAALAEAIDAPGEDAPAAGAVAAPPAAAPAEPSPADVPAGVQEVEPATARDVNATSLSSDQERLWLLDRLRPGTAAYHVPAAVRLRGPLDALAMGVAVARVVERHEALRTVLVAGPDGVPAALVLPFEPPRLATSDLGALPAAERPAEALRLARVDARAPFDLAAGPPFRVRLVRLADDDHVLTFTVHHIMADAWSAGIVLQDVLAAYAGASGGLAPDLGAPMRQATAVLAERSRRLPEVLARGLPWWTRTLARPTPELRLPWDRPRPEIPSLEGGHRFVAIPSDLHAGVVRVARELHASTFVVLLAALDALLVRCSGETDILVGAPIANRPSADVARTVGFLANTIVLRVDAAGDPSTRELLARARRAVHDAYDRQEVPLADVVEAVRPRRVAGRNPLFSVMLSVVPVVVPPPGPLQIELLDVSPGATDYDLFVTVWDGPGAARVGFGYSADLFDAATADLLADGFLAAIRAVVERPDARLSEFSLPSALAQRLARLDVLPSTAPVVITASCTADPIVPVLDFWFRGLGLPLAPEMAPYHQVLQQLLDPTSRLRSNRDGVSIVLLRLADWRRNRPGASPGDAAESLLRAELVAAIEATASATTALLMVCPLPIDGPAEAREAEAGLAREIQAVAARHPHLVVIKADEVLAAYPVHEAHDAAADRAGHVPFTPDAWAAIGTGLARVVYARRRSPWKVVVVDADNTLWQGVVAEDGPEALVVGPARRRLGERLAAMAAAGVLVCLCTRNRPDDVWAAFERHPEWPLRREHLAAWRIGWGAKSVAVRELAAELDVGLDSVVFLDDSPVECAEVAAALPTVTVLRVPDDDGALGAFLANAWPFDEVPVTDEDQHRTERYRDQARRREAQAAAPTLESFLASLDLMVAIGPAAASDLPRLEQLMLRTNQLNTTGRRMRTAELAELLDANGHVLAVRAADRFGDYGLVGAAAARMEPTALVVDSLLLSCRAMGKGIEHRIVAHLGALALAAGLDRVDVRFVSTARNQPAGSFLDGLGATVVPDVGEGRRYRLAAAVAAATVYRAGAAVDGDPAVDAADGPAEGSADGPAQGSRPEAALLARIASELPAASRIAAEVAAVGTGAAVLAPRPPWAAPGSDLERLIADAWQAVLRVENVGLRDNFFDLGGHSLLLVQVGSRLSAALGRDVPMVALFANPTVESLAAELGAGQAGWRAHGPGEAAGGPDRPDALGRGVERGRRQRDLLAQRRNRT